MHVEAKRNIADRGDLILRRTPSVEDPGGRKLQLLQGEETQTLHEGSFDLRDGGLASCDRSDGDLNLYFKLIFILHLLLCQPTCCEPRF